MLLGRFGAVFGHVPATTGAKNSAPEAALQDIFKTAPEAPKTTPQAPTQNEGDKSIRMPHH